MRKPRITRSLRAAGLFSLLVTSPVVLSLQGCTDLTESPFSVITPDNFYRNEEEIIAGLASVYSSLRASLWGYYNLSQITTDEMIVPTRGGDWYDNRRWLEIHYQDWTPSSPSALSNDDMNGSWNEMFTGVARANVLLSVLPNVPIANRDQVVAEVRALRAFYYYVLMDMFGGVPIVEDTEIMARPKNTRAEVFRFIESELLAAQADLPVSWPETMHGRMTKGAVDAILASIYINAGVFGRDEGVSGSQYNSCQGVPTQFPGAQDACAAAIAVADRILTYGYQLSTDYHANFRHDNHLSRENIFVVKNLNESGLGFEMLYRPIHYNSGIGGGWNGFSTLAETYYNYDTLRIEVLQLQRLSIHAGPFMDELRLLHSGDPRHEVFHAGFHRHLETGEQVFYRNSNIPLTFSPHYPFGETQAGEGDGVRILKWPPDPNFVGSHHSNDFAYFRLAEIYLIKAEAHAVLGQDAQALAALNTVRQRAMPDKPISGVGGTALRDAILRERHMEFAGEAKRRQDLIRAGRFTQPWTAKCAPPSPGLPASPGLCNNARTILFPIPQTQMDANPLLVQNPGY